MNKKLAVVLIILFYAALAAVFHLISPNIADPDGFYHLRHAGLYLQNGIFSSDFPWTQFSVIRIYATDLWYGFHIILMPFAALSRYGLKITSIFLTFVTFLGLWFLFKKNKVKWPALWPVFVFVSGPNIMDRLLMLRPHNLSMLLGALILPFFVYGLAAWPFLILGFLMAWIHLSLIWVGFLTGGAVFLAKGLFEKKWEWSKAGLFTAGAILGWLARPQPFNALKLVYVQVFELMKVKQQTATLLFGSELFPFTAQHLFENFSGFMLIWLFSAGVFVWLYRKYFSSSNGALKTLLFSNLILSVMFFIMTVAVARRSHDFWVIFGGMFIALVFTSVLNQNKFVGVKNSLSMVLALVFMFLLFFTPYRNSITLKDRGTPPDQFKTAALWLKDNSNAGDIVFNTHWSDFPMLFYWNQKNYYIGGMDPIFQYAYNPSLYWKFHYLSADIVTLKTCGAAACTLEMLEDTYGVLKNEFKAKYVFLEKIRNPAFYSYLEVSTDRYEKKLDTGAEAVYFIK